MVKIACKFLKQCISCPSIPTYLLICTSATHVRFANMATRVQRRSTQFSLPAVDTFIYIHTQRTLTRFLCVSQCLSIWLSVYHLLTVERLCHTIYVYICRGVFITTQLNEHVSDYERYWMTDPKNSRRTKKKYKERMKAREWDV